MILVIDNYDSFTYNLVQLIGNYGPEVTVRRNDQVTVEEVAGLRPQGIVLSPGPCRPTDSGVCLDIARSGLDPSSLLFGVPLLGVCLGHQVIGLVSGGTVEKAGRVIHGKASLIEHDGKGVFEGLECPMTVARYHSLSIKNQTLPEGFTVTARSIDDGEIMGIRHNSLPIEGVQFHPESILTPTGSHLIKNFLRMTDVGVSSI